MESGGGERKRQEWGGGGPLCLRALPSTLPALRPNCPRLQLPHGLAKCMTPLAARLLAAKGTGSEKRVHEKATGVWLTLDCKVSNKKWGLLQYLLELLTEKKYKNKDFY